MDVYILQTEDVVDEQFIQFVEDENVYVKLLFALVTANHPVRFEHAVQTKTIFDIGDDKRYELMMHMIITLTNPNTWIDQWFSVDVLYTRYETLNNITTNHRYLILNEIMNNMQADTQFDAIVTRAIATGCNVLSSKDGVPPILNLYNICQEQLFDSSEYMARVVFNNIDYASPRALNKCRLRATNENLLHFAASRLDFEGMEYMVRRLGMDVNATYINRNTNGENTGFDNIIEAGSIDPSRAYAQWFDTLGADKNLLLRANGRSYTQLTKYCGLKDPTVARLFIHDNAVNVHLGSINPCLVAASSGHDDIVVALLDAGVEVGSYYDSSGCSAVFYMIQHYHRSYETIFHNMSNEFIETHLVNRIMQWKVVHAIACYGPTELLKYFIEERNVCILDLDAQGMDMIQMLVVHLNKEANSDVVNRIYKNLNYLLLEVGFKPDVVNEIIPTYSQPNDTVTVSSVDMVLAALFHYIYRVNVHVSEDTMMVPADFNPDTAMVILNNQLADDSEHLQTVFEENDKDNGQNQQEIENNVVRIKAGLEYAYSIFPVLENQLASIRQKIITYRINSLVHQNAAAYEVKANRALNILYNIILKHRGRLYELAVRMIQMSRHINPIFKQIFYNKPLLSDIMQTGMTLRGLATPAAIQATRGDIDVRFKWWT
ncbi:hypothetical protein ECIV_ORF38 [European chub iridovirus]|nr:hypothetical protein ECIV_ORF38 [European chub iridovirus]